jgi:hypothetical protein
LETTGGNDVHVAPPDWFYEVADQKGEIVVFGDGVLHTLNYRDLVEYTRRRTA